MAMKRKIAAILAADVAGYSKLMAADEEGTIARLASCREIADELIKKYGGRIFNTAGDAVMAEFSSTVEAVRCAVDVQESLKTRNIGLPPERQMHFRIGISVGDVIEQGTDLLGDGVNIAARLEGLATPGGICVSRSVFEQVSNKAQISFADLGEQMVKNIPTPVHAYRVDALGAMSAAPAQTSKSRAAMPPPHLIAAGAAGALALVLGGWLLVPLVSGPRTAPEATAARPAPQAVAVPPQPARVSGAPPLAAPPQVEPGSAIGRLTILSPPAGSTCQAQVLEMNPRFVETVVDLPGDQPVLEIEGAGLCGLAVSGSGQTQVRFAPGTVAGVVPSVSTGGRIVFNPSNAGGRLPDLAVTGGAIDKIELRRR
jgi:class 3 adenylate cyclase